jgi:GNAT superfamily N-acetyltransferase
VRIESVEGNDAGRWLGAVRDIYAAVFAEPPYGEGPAEVARFIEGFPNDAARAGFGLVIALLQQQPVGFAFGYTMTADMPVWQLFTESAGAAVPAAAIDEGRMFFLFELAVLAQWRRRGIGHALHDRLLDGRDEKAAILTTRPEAAPARATYLARGWRPAGHLARAGQPRYDILVKTLAE